MTKQKSENCGIFMKSFLFSLNSKLFELEIDDILIFNKKIDDRF